MASTSVLKWFRGRQSLADDFLLSARHFEAALRRERMRADRSLTPFTLLTLEFSSAAASQKTFATAAEILERRIRETDLAGRFKERSIGIILPDTSTDGAWKLAEDLRLLFLERKLAPDFSVYLYPTFDDEDFENGDPAPADSEVEVPGAQALPLQLLLASKLPLWKRWFDIVGASAGLVLTSPLLLFAITAIKLTSKGPVFFRQRRDGLGGRAFQIYKFRTMITGADALKSGLRAASEQDGPAFKLRNDPRVTRVGQFLRSTSIDELPQLINVLKGEMSLVGPRPLPCDESAACTNWQKQRLCVTPGLTCIWQVKGRSRVSFNEWMRMDLQYIRSRGFRFDLKLLLQTVQVVLMRKGAY